MGRFFGCFGFILIGCSVVFLLVSLLATDNPVINGAIESFACSPNEELVVERSRWSLPNGERGENITFFCEIEPGQRRSVTDTVAPLFIIGFAGMLLLGIFMIIVGASRSAKSITKNYTNTMQSYLADFDQGDGSVRSVSVQGNIESLPPETRKMVEDMLGGAVTHIESPKANSFVDRLQQLQEAYDKGLITQEEYDRTRQAILDSMDD